MAWLLIVLAALTVVGCGSDGDGKPGSDAEYVDGFCKATLRANERSQVLPMTPGERVSSETLKAMGMIYEDFAADLSKLSPPADLKDFHDRWVVEWKKAAQQMKTGDTGTDPFLALERMEPPQTVAERFQAVAETNESCRKAGVSFREQNASPGATPSSAETPVVFSSPVVDYSDPSVFKRPGPQSSLSATSRAVLAAELGAGLSGTSGIGRVFRWMTASFRNQSDGGASIGTTDANALIASRLLSGCHDWALVMTAVLRDFGYPAFMADAAGLQWAEDYAGGKTRSFAGHVFAEVFVDGEWVLVDSTAGNYTTDYDPANPAIAYAGAGDSNGFYVLFKGVDPASYGVTNPKLQQRMAAFAATLDGGGLDVRLPLYRWQALPR